MPENTLVWGRRFRLGRDYCVSASTVDLAAGQFSPRLVDSRPRPRAEQSGDSIRMALRIVDFIQPVVVHAQLFDWLDQAHPGLRATARAAEPLRAVVHVEQTRKTQCMQIVVAPSAGGHDVLVKLE